jgi:hypothetical protein
VRLAVPGRTEKEHAPLPRDAEPRVVVARREERGEVLDDLAPHLRGKHEVVERRGADGGVQLGVLLPALAVDDEELLPRGMAELANGHDERFGDLAVAREHPPVKLIAGALRTLRDGHDEPVVLPGHVVDAVGRRTREGTVAALGDRPGNVRGRPGLLELRLDEERRIPVRVDLQVRPLRCGACAVPGAGESVEVERVVPAFDQSEVRPGLLQRAPDAVRGEAALEGPREQVDRGASMRC